MTQIEKIRAVLDSGMSDQQKVEVIRDVVKAASSFADALKEYREWDALPPKRVEPVYVPYLAYPSQPWYPSYPRWSDFTITCGGQSNMGGTLNFDNISRSHEVTGANLRITSGGQS